MTYEPRAYWDGRVESLDAQRALYAERFDEKTRLTEAVKRLPFDAKDAKLLDYGCGTGFWLNHWLDLGFNVTAVDISEPMLAVARERARECWFKHVEPGEPLPFKDDAFDVAVTTKVLLHVQGPAIAPLLRELGRVARRHIHLTFFDPDEDLAEHCFNHIYPEVFREAGLTVERQMLRYDTQWLYEVSR